MAPRPDDVPGDRVVAVGDPGITLEGIGELAPELIVRGLGPVGAVAVGVELDVGDVEKVGELLRQLGLAGTDGADDEEPGGEGGTLGGVLGIRDEPSFD